MAINFNGSSQRIAFSAPPDTNGLSGVTCSFWVYLNSAPAEYIGVVMDYSTNGTTNPRCRFGITNLRLLQTEVRIDDSNPVRTGNSTGNIPLTSWTHVVIFISAPDDTNDFYINGVLDSTDTPAYGASNFLSSDSLSGSTGGATGSNLYLPGKIDDLRIYDRGLSLEEVQTIYYSRGHDNIKNGLIRRMLLNEAASGATVTSIVYDETGISGNGSAINSPLGSESQLSLRKKF